MRLILWLCLVVLVAVSGIADADSQSARESASDANLQSPLASHFTLKDLYVDEQGFTINTSTDGFLTLGGIDLPRSKACNLVLDVEFKEPMFRPGLFEIFWAVNPGAFGEGQKARILINHQDTHAPAIFVVPLCKLYSFSGNLSQPHHQRNIVGLRLDYPMNREVGIKLNQVKLYSEGELATFMNDVSVSGRTVKFVELEPFERLSGTAFLSLDVIIPKVYFGIEDGLSRLANDYLFLLVWLLIIAVFIGLIVRTFPAPDSHD